MNNWRDSFNSFINTEIVQWFSNTFDVEIKKLSKYFSKSKRENFPISDIPYCNSLRLEDNF